MEELVAKACLVQEKTFTLRGPMTTTAGSSRPQPRSLATEAVSTHSAPAAQTFESGTQEQKSRRPADQKCYRCGLSGHMARNCTYQRPRSDEQEARGNRRLSSMTTQDLSAETPSSSQQEIRELREKQPLLAEAIKVAGVFNVVQQAESDGKSRLGPTLFFPVEVNGCTTNALVDTGSPATIASQVCAGCPDQALLCRRDRSTVAGVHSEEVSGPGGSPAKLRRTTAGFHSPNRVGTFTRVTTTVVVQKDAPNDLLIGTDVWVEKQRISSAEKK